MKRILVSLLFLLTSIGIWAAKSDVVTSNTVNATVSFSSSGSYEWEWYSSSQKLRSTNYHVASSTSSSTITISNSSSCTFSFNYAVSSEANYDKLTITLDGRTIVNAISGTNSSIYSTTLDSGSHTLVLKYSKDDLSNSNDDRAYVSNMKFERIAPTPINLDVTLENAGDLKYYITDNNKDQVKYLKLSGPVNGDDMKIVIELLQSNNALLSSLDFKNVRFVSGGGSCGTYYYEWTGSYDSYEDPAGTYTQDDIISSGLFYNCRNLTDIILPDSTKQIKYRAFYDCTKLNTIVIPNSVTEIGESAFSRCSELSNIRLSNNITKIAARAFSGCKFSAISLPNSLTSIGNRAFELSGLVSVTIPENVTSIDSYAFANCRSLSTVELKCKNAEFGYHHYDKYHYFYEGDSEEGNTFYGCSALKKVIVENLTQWLSFTFYDVKSNPTYYSKGLYVGSPATELTSLVIPEGTTKIKANTFCNCEKVSSVSFPTSLTTVESRAFEGCASITKVSTPSLTAWCRINFKPNYDYETVYDSNGNVARDTNDEWDWDIEIPRLFYKSNPLYYAHALYVNDNAITNLSIPNDVESIGEGAFAYCTSLTSVDFPASLTSISTMAFHGCSGILNVKAANKDSWNMISFSPKDDYTYGIELGVECDGYYGDYKYLRTKDFSSNPIYATCTSGLTSFSGIAWSTSDASIVSVNTNGEITANGAGKATVFLSDGSTRSFCNFEIGESTSLSQSITLSESSIELGKDETFILTATVLPENANNKVVLWTSSNDSIASVNEQGVISGKSAGTVTITATTTDGTNLSADCEVTVTVETGNTDPGNDGSEDDNDAESATDLTTIQTCTYVPELVARQGETFSLPINLKSKDENIVGFQFDMKLPEGISLARNSRGKITAPIFNAETDRTSAEYHTVSASEQADGTVRVLCYSNANELILGTDGTVCDFTATISEDMAAGKYNIVLTNIVVTTADLQQTKVGRIVSVLTIPSYIIGDANGDEEINVTDIASTASYILGTTPANFVEKAADVNEDCEINVTDIAGIANIILSGGSNAKARGFKAKTMVKSEYPSLEIVPFAVESRTRETSAALDLVGDVDDEFVGFQCDIYLPEGISWKLNARKKATAPSFNTAADRTGSEYHTANAAIQSDGSVRILCYSNSNEVILGKEGTVLDLPLVFEDGLADGVYQVDIKNIVLTHNDISQTKIDEYKFSIMVGTPELATVSVYGDITAKAIADINHALCGTTKLSSIDMSGALHVSNAKVIETANPNALIYIAADANIANSINVVKGGNCNNYILTDGYSVEIPCPFTAVQASYTRSLSSEWGTICLPFAIESNASVQYYKLASVSGETMTFEPVVSVEAGEPAVFKSVSGGTLKINVSYVTIAEGLKEIVQKASGWNMKGTFAAFNNNPADCENDIYYISSNKFWYANQAFPVSTFRGWFETSKTTGAKARAFSIIDASNAATGVNYVENADGTVNVIFDLTGKKISAPQNGINIINGKKVKTK